MPRSFASSLLLRKSAFGACCLIALALLATGCGGRKKDVHYSVAEVEGAFSAAGISLSGPGQRRRGFGPGGDFTPRSRPTVAPAPSGSEAAQPLTALLTGVRNTFLLPTIQPDRSRLTVLRGAFMYVYVYPRDGQATRTAANYEDILAAQQILHEIQFGYYRSGNVVVRYTIYNSNSRIPGYLGEWKSLPDLNAEIAKQARAGLTGLTGLVPS